MSFKTRQFNWVRRATAWEQAQAWRERRAAMRDDFENLTAAATERFLAAQTNLRTGMASLAAQASITRARAAVQAKIDRLV